MIEVESFDRIWSVQVWLIPVITMKPVHIFLGMSEFMSLEMVPQRVGKTCLLVTFVMRA